MKFIYLFVKILLNIDEKSQAKYYRVANKEILVKSKSTIKRSFANLKKKEKKTACCFEVEYGEVTVDQSYNLLFMKKAETVLVGLKSRLILSHVKERYR